MIRLLLPVLLSACATHRGATDVLGDYLEAEQRGRYQAAHALLTASDRAARPLDAYAAEHLQAGPIWLAVAQRTRFTFKVADADDALVSVDVTATHPDMKAVEAAVPGLPPEALAMAEDPAAEMRAHVESTLDARPVPEVSDQLTYAVRKEGDAWRVWLALDRQDAAIAGLAEAQTAIDAKDATKAREALQGILALEPDPAGVVVTVQREARAALEQLDRVAPE